MNKKEGYLKWYPPATDATHMPHTYELGDVTGPAFVNVPLAIDSAAWDMPDPTGLRWRIRRFIRRQIFSLRYSMSAKFRQQLADEQAERDAEEW